LQNHFRPEGTAESWRRHSKAERDRIDAAIKALTALTVTPRINRRVKRTMSAAGRRKISLAQKARWAKRASRSQGAERPKRTLSAAGRRKIAAAQRARWAKVKARKK
jgi:hypothetical protein